MEELMLTNTQKPGYLNKDLNVATLRIRGIGEKMREHLFEVAAVIAKVDREKLYEIDGFKSVHEWTLKEFNIKSSRSYSLLTIGQRWTVERVDKRGHVTGYAMIISPDYSTTQTEKMLPAGLETATRLHEEGKISPAMSAKEIEKVIKAEKTPIEETEPEELETVESEEVEDTQSEICIRVTDTEGNQYDIPESVLKQYKL